MRRAGRVSLLLLVAILGVVAVGILLLFSKENPGEAGARFMDALARGDVDKLVASSYAPGKSQEELRKDWEFATQKVGKYYRFRWKITSSNVQTDDSAVVKLQVERNFGPGSYEENYQLPLHKDKAGKWMVDASGISREMYPGLPRSGGADTDPSATEDKKAAS